jgi:hypothetical protein
MTHLFTQLQTPLPLLSSVNALEFGKEVIQQQIDNFFSPQTAAYKTFHLCQAFTLFSSISINQVVSTTSQTK